MPVARERAIFSERVPAFIRETQPKEWTKLEALRGDMTGRHILGVLCKWMDQDGALATERTIALLKEGRAALIGAAATGQMDVGVAA